MVNGSKNKLKPSKKKREEKRKLLFAHRSQLNENNNVATEITTGKCQQLIKESEVKKKSDWPKLQILECWVIREKQKKEGLSIYEYDQAIIEINSNERDPRNFRKYNLKKFQ